MTIEVRTQLELDAALKVPGALIDLISGVFRLVTTGTSAPRLRLSAGVKLNVEAWESSQPHVEARGSSQPHVEAWESSQPHVVAWGSSQPHVEARESSQAALAASGYVQCSVFGMIAAKATANVAVLIRGKKAQVEGGKQTRYEINTPAEWCDYYGVRVENGIAFVYKGVDDNFNSDRGGTYTPGTSPEAADWDGGKAECGGGFHFSPTPAMTIEFARGAKRFVECPVALADMRAPRDGDTYPQKIKAARVCGPIVEVNRQGKPINQRKDTEHDDDQDEAAEKPKRKNGKARK